jgi:hypothetical protein
MGDAIVIIIFVDGITFIIVKVLTWIGQAIVYLTIGLIILLAKLISLWWGLRQTRPMWFWGIAAGLGCACLGSWILLQAKHKH